MQPLERPTRPSSCPPNVIHHATVRATRQLAGLRKELHKLEDLVERLCRELDPESVQRHLLEAEKDVQYISTSLGRISRRDVASEVKDIRQRIAAVNEILKEQRSRHPDSFPLRINNGVWNALCVMLKLDHTSFRICYH